jgi:hypothetical protein
MLSAKYEALKNYLIESGEATAEELTEDVSAVYNENWKTFEIIGQEYKVLTDEEANEETADYIKESLWAFNAEFILQHSSAYEETTNREDEEIIKALRYMQGVLCESANALVKALISDLETFISDAIEADGRGHFISSWDGIENESGDFYIYRTN